MNGWTMHPTLAPAGHHLAAAKDDGAGAVEHGKPVQLLGVLVRDLSRLRGNGRMHVQRSCEKGRCCGGRARCHRMHAKQPALAPPPRQRSLQPAICLPCTPHTQAARFHTQLTSTMQATMMTAQATRRTAARVSTSPPATKPTAHQHDADHQDGDPGRNQDAASQLVEPQLVHACVDLGHLQRKSRGVPVHRQAS